MHEVRASGAGGCRERTVLLHERSEILILYKVGGLSVREIAGQLGVDRSRVSALLHQAGVEVPNRGRGRLRLARRARLPESLPELLRELYLGRRLTARAIGELLGVSESTVRARLVELGVPRRTKGGFDRLDRLDPDPALVRELYVEQGMTSDEVAASVGSNRASVLRTAHGHGLPVRPPASLLHRGSGSTFLVEALYSDRLVVRTLALHGVPKVPAFGPVWARFPEPVPLGRELASDLYERCGLALAHIELLTGQPAESVRKQLLAWRIPLRPPGGRCPFLQRLSNSY